MYRWMDICTLWKLFSIYAGTHLYGCGTNIWILYYVYDCVCKCTHLYVFVYVTAIATIVQGKYPMGFTKQILYLVCSHQMWDQ